MDGRISSLPTHVTAWLEPLAAPSDTGSRVLRGCGALAAVGTSLRPSSAGMGWRLSLADVWAVIALRSPSLCSSTPGLPPAPLRWLFTSPQSTLSLPSAISLAGGPILRHLSDVFGFFFSVRNAALCSSQTSLPGDPLIPR